MKSKEYKDLSVRIGAVIREARKGQNRTIKNLCAASGTNSSNLSRVERGDCSLTVPTFCRIAIALGRDPGALLAEAMRGMKPET